MRKATTRIAGHTLPDEGRLNGDNGLMSRCNGAGSIQCSCGQPSPVLPSTAARKRWHRDHKDTIRNGGTR
jgi:hypothetical protein